MITKYGLETALVLIIISCAIFVSGFLITHTILRVPLIIIGIALLLFTLNFFRDPNRSTPQIENGIISPADGKVVQISNVHDDDFIHGDAIQVSIFMSPLNVHVNRIPISGVVRYFRYIKGEYLVAFDDKSSTRNERTIIGIDNGKFKVLFKQIAGFIARRIVCTLKEGDSVKTGERFGMIKFGSRVDVLMPVDTELKVKLNTSTIAGETVLGIVPSPEE